MINDKYFLSTNILKNDGVQHVFLKDISFGISNKIVAIGESVHIINEFFNRHNMLIVMDKYKTNKLNKLTKIQYNNPDDLYSNNCKKLFRIDAIKRDGSLLINTRYMIRNSIREIGKKISKLNFGQRMVFIKKYPQYDKISNTLIKYLEKWGLDDMITNDLNDLKDVKVNNLNDYANLHINVIKRFIRLYELGGKENPDYKLFNSKDTFSTIRYILREAAIMKASEYEREEELLIKPDSITGEYLFRIPEGSYIFFKVDFEEPIFRTSTDPCMFISEGL